MAKIGSLLAVATVNFYWLMDSNIYILQSGGGGAYMQDKTTYVGT